MSRNCPILDLNKNLAYRVLRIGQTSDRVTKGRVYVMRYKQVFQDEHAWVIERTDRPNVRTQPSIHANSSCGTVIGSTDRTHIVTGSHRLQGWYRCIQNPDRMSGNTFTAGNLYRFEQDGKFFRTTSDDGHPYTVIALQNWEFVCGLDEVPNEQMELGYLRDVRIHRGNEEGGKEYCTDPTDIEYAEFIDGTDAKAFNDDALIEAILTEEQAIEHLRSVKASSDYINRRIQRHEASIVELVKLLDARPQA